MNKHKLFSAIGVISSFAIAFGGWALTCMLIDAKSDALLSTSGITQINAPDLISTAIPSDNEDGSSYDLPSLSEEKIAMILKNWTASSITVPHEPMATQITMDQAITFAKANWTLFGEQGFIPIEQYAFDLAQTNAYLCQQLPRDKSDQFLEPMYSYWNVSFRGESISVTMHINAVTGHVWKTYVKSLSNYTDLGINDVETLLTDFMSGIGLKTDSAPILTEEAAGMTAYAYFANGSACAVATILTRPTTNGKRELKGISIYLSTQAP